MALEQIKIFFLLKLLYYFLKQSENVQMKLLSDQFLGYFNYLNVSKKIKKTSSSKKKILISFKIILQEITNRKSRSFNGSTSVVSFSF